MSTAADGIVEEEEELLEDEAVAGGDVDGATDDEVFTKLA